MYGDQTVLHHSSPHRLAGTMLINTSRTPRNPWHTQLNSAGVGRCKIFFQRVSKNIATRAGRCKQVFRHVLRPGMVSSSPSHSVGETPPIPRLPPATQAWRGPSTSFFFAGVGGKAKMHPRIKLHAHMHRTPAWLTLQSSGRATPNNPPPTPPSDGAKRVVGAAVPAGGRSGKGGWGASSLQSPQSPQVSSSLCLWRRGFTSTSGGGANICRMRHPHSLTHSHTHTHTLSLFLRGVCWCVQAIAC